MTTKGMDDLFARLRHQTDEDKRPQQEAPPPPEERGRVNDHPVLWMTVDEWIDDLEAPHTFELGSPRGKLYMTKCKKTYKRLVAAGEVAFSPLEVERFIEVVHKDPSAINEQLLDQIYQMKRLFGAKLAEISLFDDPADLPDEEPVEEPEDARPA